MQDLTALQGQDLYQLCPGRIRPHPPAEEHLHASRDLAPRPRHEWLKLAHKIEPALSDQPELFDLDPTIYLYDLTSTYFEGQARNNPKAKRGTSR